jgi:hypothetical protein
VAPIPKEKAPSAPWLVVWESVPTTTKPGLTYPFSGNTWWQIPPIPNFWFDSGSLIDFKELIDYQRRIFVRHCQIDLGFNDISCLN